MCHTAAASLSLLTSYRNPREGGGNGNVRFGSQRATCDWLYCVGITQRNGPCRGRLLNAIGLVAVSFLNAMGLVTIGPVNSMGFVAISGVNAMGVVAIGGVNSVGLVAIGGLNSTGIVAVGGSARSILPVF